MTSRSIRRLAWLPLAVLLAEFATYALLTTRAAHAGVSLARADLPIASVVVTGSVVMSLFGGFLVSRRPGNAVGWLFAVIPCGFWIKGMTDAIAFYAHFARHGAVAGGVVAAWMSGWDYLPAVGTFGSFVFLLFPDGHLPSRRWRPAAWFAVAAIVLPLVDGAFVPGRLGSFAQIRNPYPAPPALAAVVRSARLLAVLLPLSFLVAVASLVARVRSGSAVLRQQVKWVAYVGVFFAIGLASTFVIGFGLPGALAVFAPVCALPVAAVIAIQRYRLFDIDRIISRTVSYALVTAVLVAAFVLVALVPTTLLGGRRAPSWLIAVATLLVAALFRPVRRRVQAAVDRRFNRARYDVERTIESFAARMREETDVSTLGAELEGIVARTMQPAHVSLWLRM